MTAWPPNLHVRPIQSWPGEHTPGRSRAPFRSPWRATLDLLDRELHAVHALTPVLQVAIDEREFRLDGYPRANASFTHPGVILAFDTKRIGSLSFPCDRFDHWQDNLRAIALGMEALRKVDRYGITRRNEQYTGWRAIGSGLAMPGRMTVDEARTVLVEHSGIAGADGISDPRTLVRLARGTTHPDRHDGDRTAWDKVEQAALALGVSS